MSVFTSGSLNESSLTDTDTNTSRVAKDNLNATKPVQSLVKEASSDEVSSSITQTWTDQAIKCFMTKADCENCVIPKGNYSFDCHMDKVVPQLIKTLGQPDQRRIRKLTPYVYQ